MSYKLQLELTLREYIKSLDFPDEYCIFNYRMLKNDKITFYTITTPTLQSDIISHVSWGGFIAENVLNEHRIYGHHYTKVFFTYDEASDTVDSHHNPVLFGIPAHMFINMIQSKHKKIDITSKKIISDCDCGGKVIGYKDSELYGHAQWCILQKKPKF